MLPQSPHQGDGIYGHVLNASLAPQVQERGCVMEIQQALRLVPLADAQPLGTLSPHLNTTEP